MRGALQVARPEIRDSLRQRRGLLVRALTPPALLAMVVALAVLAGTGLRDAPDTYVIAVEGDLEALEAAMAGPTADIVLELEPSDDALGDAAGESAVAGVEVEPQPDGTLELVVYQRATNREANAAVAELEARLAAGWADRHRGPDPPQVQLDRAVVEATESEVTRAAGGPVAALVVLQGAVLIGGAAARFTTRRSSGTLAQQLLVPVSRIQLVTGKALTELAVGLTATIPLTLLAGFAGAAVMAATDRSAGIPVALAVLALSLVTITLPINCVGVLIGVVARSPEQASLASALAIVLAAVVANLAALGSPLSETAAVVPVVGSVASLRAAFGDGTSLPALLLASASSLVLAWATIALAARRIGTDRMVLRIS